MVNIFAMTSINEVDLRLESSSATELSENFIDFKNYKVNSNLMKVTRPNSIFLHCLPRGDEVSEEVFLGKKSKVWQQALNRVHVQKSILLYSFGKLR